MIGIYKIQNRKNGKVYIGQTNNIERRKEQHFNALRNGKHENKDMQNDFNKYGETSFTFIVVEECPLSLLNRQEKYWIAYFNSACHDAGYNLTKGGGTNKRKFKGRPACLLDEITDNKN